MILKIDRNNIRDLCVSLGQTLSTPGEWMSGTFVRSVFTSMQPERVGNCAYVPLEVFRRGIALLLCVLTMPLTLTLWVLGKSIAMIGDCLKKDAFTYIKGTYEKEVKESKEFSILSWNVCSFFGGLPWLDGLSPASTREEGIAKGILQHKPSIVALQEVSFRSGKKLAQLLKNDYAHIFTRIGHPSFTTMESCLFFATNLPVLDSYFVPFSNESGIRRGCFCVKFKDFWVITTHLMAGIDKADTDKRAQEFEEINCLVQKIGHKKHVFLAIDANISDKQEYRKSDLSSHYWDPRNKGKRPDEISLHTATYTNQFQALRKGIKIKEDEKLEIDDYLVAARYGKLDIPKMRIKRIEGFKDAAKPDSKTLSDHHGLLCTINLS
ncbi:MAG: hypothetical protein V4494_01105 [Chlamydiota bacterium]